MSKKYVPKKPEGTEIDDLEKEWPAETSVKIAMGKDYIDLEKK